MATKNEVATQESKEVALAGGMGGFAAFKQGEHEVVGLDVNASDMKLPKVKLLQSTSQDVQKCKDGSLRAGQFYNTILQTSKDSVDCVLLDQGKSMVMWKKPFKRGDEPLCRSFDGRVKSEGCGDGDCTKCQYSTQNPSAWNNLAENETRPACSMSYVFLAKDCETGMPFRIIVAGASVTNAKDFLNKLIPLKISPFCCKVTLTSKQEENESGVFYVVDFENLRPNDDLLDENGNCDEEKYRELEDMSKSYKELFMTQIVQNDIVDVEGVEESSSDTQESTGGKAGKLF